MRTSDPDGRLATMSCGAALHHARAAMAAHGWQITVTQMSQGAYRDLLAPTPRRPQVTDRPHIGAAEPLDWLRAGEALSAGWLTATATTSRFCHTAPRSRPLPPARRCAR
jgi:hypothetical protein